MDKEIQQLRVLLHGVELIRAWIRSKRGKHIEIADNIGVSRRTLWRIASNPNQDMRVTTLAKLVGEMAKDIDVAKKAEAKKPRKQ